MRSLTSLVISKLTFQNVHSIKSHNLVIRLLWKTAIHAQPLSRRERSQPGQLTLSLQKISRRCLFCSDKQWFPVTTGGAAHIGNRRCSDTPCTRTNTHNIIGNNCCATTCIYVTDYTICTTVAHHTTSTHKHTPHFTHVKHRTPHTATTQWKMKTCSHCMYAH